MGKHEALMAAAGVGAATLFAGAMVVNAGAGGAPASAQPAGDCAALTSVKLDNGKVVSAEPVKPPYEAPRIFMYTGTVQRPFCRVVGVLTPTPSSEINFEVWLPTEGYTGRFAGVGNGGLTGAIFYPSMAAMVNRGYAALSSDRGHKGGGFDMAFSSEPEKVIDFRERADHLATVAAKTLVAKYYGVPPRYSYWSGCSGGGVQGYTAAWLHPDDYDGIIAGAAPMLFKGDTPDMGAMTGIAPILWKAPTLTKEKLEMVTRAAVAACDADDGVKDGVISDPKSCKFDPATLICRPGQTAECLSPTEASVLNEAYASGHSRGAEYYWKALGGGDGPSPVTRFMGQVTYSPSQDQQFLQGFAAKGHKMIAYAGMNDFPMPKMVKYQEMLIADRQKGGKSREQAIAEVNMFHRLFLLPGMEHCVGGPGPNNIVAAGLNETSAKGAEQDVYTAMEDWVEKGKAPDSIVATKYKGDDPKNGALMSRPICAYPLQAKWNQKGDWHDGHNFSCVKPPSA
jgi:feruloyl esterase